MSSKIQEKKNQVTKESILCDHFGISVEYQSAAIHIHTHTSIALDDLSRRNSESQWEVGQAGLGGPG